MSEPIDLTPRGILRCLRRIEGAIPQNSLNLYKPLVLPVASNLTNETLVEETESMLKFVGLNGFVVDVQFEKTDEGIGGYITSANNNIDKAVHIKVSEKYSSTNSWKSCIAILAHEICHKLLAVNGLYEKDTNQNETLVDLATIYVGFGELILSGYRTMQHKLGYLEDNNYRMAQQIMYKIYGQKAGIKTGLEDSDVLLDQTLDLWEKSESEYSLLKDCFISQEEQTSEFLRNLSLLEQLTKQCRMDLIHEYTQLDSLFFKNLRECEGNFKNKIMAFSMLYDAVASYSYPLPKNNPVFQRLNSIIGNAIYDIYQTYQQKHPVDLKYDFECPQCQAKSPNNGKVENRNTVLRCPKCGCHYLYFGEKWNFTQYQHKIREEKRLVNEDINKRVEEKAEQYRNEYRLNLLLSNEKVNELKKAINEIRENEQSRYREAVLSRTPVWMRWIIRRYLD